MNPGTPVIERDRFDTYVILSGSRRGFVVFGSFDENDFRTVKLTTNVLFYFNAKRFIGGEMATCSGEHRNPLEGQMAER